MKDSAYCYIANQITEVPVQESSPAPVAQEDVSTLYKGLQLDRQRFTLS